MEIKQRDAAGDGRQPVPARGEQPAVRIGLILLAVMVVSALGSLYWVQRNVVIIGHDAASYLENTLKYTRFFTNLSIPTLFQGFTFPDYRTPALYLATQPFFWLFGADADSAQLLNIAVLPAVILLTYYLGKAVAGWRAGVIAAIGVAWLPMVAAMARLYYTEMLLTAALTLNLLGLYKSRHFAARGWSLLWGASLGVGLLIKWTMPIYIALPVIWSLWQGGLVQRQWQALRSWRPAGRAAVLALLIGMLLAAIWYWPSRSLAQDFPLGDWLAVAWTILFAVTAYALLTARSATGHWWAALSLAIAIASLWYLPRSDFPARLLYFDQVRAPEGASPASLSNYTRYIGFFYDEHLGPLAFWLIIPLALVPWLKMAWQRSGLNPGAGMLWLSLLSAYLVLSLILQHNARNLVPLLPAMSILAAVALLAYPRPYGHVLGAIWLLVLVVQWSLVTFQPLAPLFAQSRAAWVRSDYVIPPASGATDPGYWVAPDVLATIGNEEGEPDSLGILVDTWELHRGLFRYLVERDGMNLTIMALTEQDSRGWSDALANRWLLVKDGNNSHVGAPGQAVLERIARGDSLFHQLYVAARRYPLPNGDTVTLYHRADGPRQPQDYPVITIETTPIADALNMWWRDGATVIFGDRDVALWTGIHDLRADHVLIPDRLAGAYTELPRDLQGTIFAVTRYERGVLDELQDAYFARDLISGDTVLSVFGRPAQPLASLLVTSPWSEVSIPELRGRQAIEPGDVLPLEVTITPQAARPLKLSVRLLAADGATVAQNDVIAEGRVRLGLLAPPDLAPGTYSLGAVLYDPATLETVATIEGEEMGVLAPITVVSPS